MAKLIWHNWNQLSGFFRPRRETVPEWLLGLAILIYSTFFSAYLSQKYDYFRTGYFDFGQAVQTAWLVSQGHLNGLALGRPITIIAGLFFAIYPHPQTLLTLQSYALGIGALPVYLLAHRELENKWNSLGFAGLYLINPLLWGINQYEFHDLAFGVPLLLFAAYFCCRGKMVPYLASFGLALACSPFVVVIGLGLASSMVIGSWKKGRLRSDLAFPLATLAVALGFVFYLEAIPFLPSFQLSTVGTQSYTFFGSSRYINPVAIIENPLGSISYSLVPKSLYLLGTFAPLLFLPIASTHRLLPAVPWLGVVLFYSPQLGAGGVGPVYELSQWSSFLVPFVFIGAVYGFVRVKSISKLKSFTGTRTAFVSMFLLTLLLATFSSGLSPIGPSMMLSLGDNTVPTETQSGSLLHSIWPSPVNNSVILDWFVSQIPTNYSVLTQNQIGSKLGERPAPVYVFYQPGYKDPKADAILVDNQMAGLCAPCLNNILTTGNYTLHLSYVEGGILLYYRLMQA